MNIVQKWEYNYAITIYCLYLWFLFIFWPFQNIINYMEIKKYMVDICKW